MKEAGEAIGEYWRALRDAQEWTRSDLIARLADALREHERIDQSTIYRWERGEQWPGGEYLIVLLALLKGSSSDLITLYQNPNATKADGAEAARRRLIVGADDAPVTLREVVLDQLDDIRRTILGEQRARDRRPGSPDPSHSSGSSQ